MRRRVILSGALAVTVVVATACAPMDDEAAQPGRVTVPTVAEPPSSEPPPPSTVEGLPTTASPPQCDSYNGHEELPLRRCDSGELVRRLQGELANSLGLDLAADGYFGNLTEAAVRRYQTEQGLEIDGIVGAATWNQLFGSSLTTDGATRGITDDWFQHPAAVAVAALQAQGFLVTDYEVCSSSVGAGEVRQIIGGDGTVYVDEDGVSPTGSQLPIGSVIEVQIGSGTAC